MAHKLPSGAYRARVKFTDFDGKHRIKSFTAPTKREAERLAGEFKYGHKIAAASPMRLSTAYDIFISGNSGTLSPSTIKGYGVLWRNYLCQIDYPLSSLTQPVVQSWMSSIGKSPKTVRNAFGLLSAILKSQGIDVPKVNLPQKEKKEFIIPQKDDIDRIIDAVAGTKWEIPFLLGATMGLRRSEMSALEWNDINFTRQRIHVHRARVKGPDGWETKGTKSYAGDRWVPMPDRVMKLLAKHEGQPVNASPDKITAKFKKVCTDLGYPFHEHLLRHYFCSVCISLGMPTAYIIKLIGHNSDAMVTKVYGHLLDERKQQVEEQLLNYFK